MKERYIECGVEPGRSSIHKHKYDVYLVGQYFAIFFSMNIPFMFFMTISLALRILKFEILDYNRKLNELY